MYGAHPFLSFDDSDLSIKVSHSHPRGSTSNPARPAAAPLSGNTNATVPAAKTERERARTYRTRQKERGLTAVKIYLPPEILAYLKGVAKAEGVTQSEAAAIALERLIRGESTTPACVASAILRESAEHSRILLL